MVNNFINQSSSIGELSSSFSAFVSASEPLPTTTTAKKETEALTDPPKRKI